jgi:hypothetical protein
VEGSLLPEVEGRLLLEVEGRLLLEACKAGSLQSSDGI